MSDHSPFDRFASNFDLGIRQNHKNVLVYRFQLNVNSSVILARQFTMNEAKRTASSVLVFGIKKKNLVCSVDYIHEKCGLNQGYNARKVNCGRVYSAYILKPVLFGRNL